MMSCKLSFAICGPVRNNKHQSNFCALLEFCARNIISLYGYSLTALEK